jgi:hypothetical protein
MPVNAGSAQGFNSGVQAPQSAAGYTAPLQTNLYSDSNPENTQLVNAQNSYNQFTQNIPQYQQQIQGQANDQAVTNTQNDQQNINTQANGRGLLYSGLNQGAQAGAATNEASNAANQIAQGNQGLQNLQYGYGNQLMNSYMNNWSGLQAQSAANTQNSLQQQGLQNQEIGGVLQGGAIAALALSDKDAKEDIKPADKALGLLVEKIEPKSFDFKDESEGEGKHYGLLAQDLEKSPAGKALVVETPKGKAVDLKKAVMTSLALHSTLSKRLKDLEAKRNG